MVIVDYNTGAMNMMWKILNTKVLDVGLKVRSKFSMTTHILHTIQASVYTVKDVLVLVV